MQRPVRDAGAARRQQSTGSRPGPFKPTVPVPRSLPVVASPPIVNTSSTTPTSGHPPVLAVARTVEPGLLERVGHEADEALAIGKRVMTMLNVESKGTSYAASAVSIDWSGITYQPAASIAQGSSDSTRDGDSLKFKGWNGHLQFTRGGVDAIVSYALIQEGPTFLTSGIPAAVFQSAGGAGAPLSEPAWDGRLGFRILKREVFALTNNTPYHIVDFRHKFNHDVQFYNGTSTVYEGQISLIFISNITAGATVPTVTFATNYSWVDN